MGSVANQWRDTRGDIPKETSLKTAAQSVPRLSLVKSKGLRWNDITFKHVTAGRNLDVVKHARAESCHRDERVGTAASAREHFTVLKCLKGQMGASGTASSASWSSRKTTWSSSSGATLKVTNDATGSLSVQLGGGILMCTSRRD